MTVQIKIKHFSREGCQVSFREDEDHDKPVFVKKCPASNVLALGYLIQEHFQTPVTLAGMSLEEYHKQVEEQLHGGPTRGTSPD